MECGLSGDRVINDGNTWLISLNGNCLQVTKGRNQRKSTRPQAVKLIYSIPQKNFKDVYMKSDNWIIKVFLFTFFITLIVSGSANYISSHSNMIVLIIITILIIILGILFDMIGTSILTVNEANFHSMASNRVKGSKKSIKLIKNKSNIANFCNDVIGDICGIISGSMGAIISLNISNWLKLDSTISALIIASIISSITVVGKAIGKKYATRSSDKIILFVGKALSLFEKEK